MQTNRDLSAQISKASFNKSEVLRSPQLRHKRFKELQKASVFGNEYDYRVDISLYTVAGLKKINTVVWYASEKFVVIENGITVPIECISRIKIL
jgi:hypothetical protein